MGPWGDFGMFTHRTFFGSKSICSLCHSELGTKPTRLPQAAFPRRVLLPMPSLLIDRGPSPERCTTLFSILSGVSGSRCYMLSHPSLLGICSWTGLQKGAYSIYSGQMIIYHTDPLFRNEFLNSKEGRALYAETE